MNKLCDSLEVLPNTAFESALNIATLFRDKEKSKLFYSIFYNLAAYLNGEMAL